MMFHYCHAAFIIFNVLFNQVCALVVSSYTNPEKFAGLSKSFLDGLSSGKQMNGWSYCHTCMCPKPPRAHHCRACQKCSLRMDHHCPLIGNCVALYNHHFYLKFLLWMVIACFWVIVLGTNPLYICLYGSLGLLIFVQTV